MPPRPKCRTTAERIAKVCPMTPISRRTPDVRALEIGVVVPNLGLCFFFFRAN